MPDWEPTTASVAAIVADHTYGNAQVVGGAGTIVGDFTGDTTPTAEQVIPLIAQAVVETDAHVLPDPSEKIRALAELAAARRAALLVLYSFFSESLAEGNTGYDELRQLWLDALAGLDTSQDDTAQTRKGIYSIPLASDVIPPEVLP